MFKSFFSQFLLDYQTLTFKDIKNKYKITENKEDTGEQDLSSNRDNIHISKAENNLRIKQKSSFKQFIDTLSLENSKI